MSTGPHIIRMPSGVIVFALLALATTTQAQIISTSVPKELGGLSGSIAKSWSLHGMYSPLAKWGYGEQYFNGTLVDPNNDIAFATLGVVDSKPLSNALFAGELVFALNKDWSASLGGWHNKIGSQKFGFSGSGVFFEIGNDTNFVAAPTSFETNVDVSVTEGHFGAFYDHIGVQVGLLYTRASSDGVVRNFVFGSDSTSGSSEGTLQAFDESFIDIDAFAVYKTGGGGTAPWTTSLGVGAYRKSGSETSHVRGSKAQTVLTGFLTGSAQLVKGWGLDASLWFVNATKSGNQLEQFQFGEIKSDAQVRFSLGVGYTF